MDLLSASAQEFASPLASIINEERGWRKTDRQLRDRAEVINGNLIRNWRKGSLYVIPMSGECIRAGFQSERGMFNAG